MIDVIGTDAGAPASLPVSQQTLLRAAYRIAAPDRLHAALRDWLESGDRLLKTPEVLLSSDQPIALCDCLHALSPEQPVVVLASGDPLWFGIGRILCERIPRQRLRFHPAPASLQLAFARLGRTWQDASWISLHGRDPEPLAQRLQQRPKALAVLTDPSRGGAETVRRILHASGLEAAYQTWLFEQLGHADERVQQLQPQEPLPDDLHPLHLLLLLAEPAAPPDPAQLPLFGLNDGLFLQHDDRPGLMTKREMRIQLLADLDLPESGVLWDLGAGVGSVGLEALRLRPMLKLLAVEQRSGGAALIKANALRLGVQPAAVLEREAETLIEGHQLPPPLAQPHRVLLGGGGRRRGELLQAVLKQLLPGGRVVIPLATLEAVAELRQLLEQSGMQVQLHQHQAWRGQPLSDGTRLAPMNPVFILSASRPLGKKA
ncbi:MAG: precorrin-6y C5,15-methyltransferase (decarboxylating) subunit CbiE [Prochlorococcus sp.]